MHNSHNFREDYPDGEIIISREVTVKDDFTESFDYPIVFSLEPSVTPAYDEENDIYRVSLPDLVDEGRAHLGTDEYGRTTYTIEYFLIERTVVDSQLKPPDQSFNITVTLVDGNDGTITPTNIIVEDILEGTTAEYINTREIEAGITVGEFVNTERTDSTEFIISGSKELTGREMTDDDRWTFTIEALADSEGKKGPLPKPASVQNNGGTFSFPPIVFTAEYLGECSMTQDGSYTCASKDYTYRVTESGVIDGVDNDSSKEFVVTVRLDENGNVTYDAPENLSGLLKFTNTYEKTQETATPEAPTFRRISIMPETGFSALRPTVLNEQPKNLSYRPLGWTLQIPSLGLITDIVEVPYTDGTYPVTWLGSSAGLLEGYALPGEGQAILTGHNHLNTTEAGPFALLKEMEAGDRLFVLDPGNRMQVFEIYENAKIAESDIKGLDRTAGRFGNSLTLITCEDERPEGGYANRRIIAARPVNNQE